MAKQIRPEELETVFIDFSKYYVPSPQQMRAHKASSRYVLFGGAMGGGKTINCNTLVQTATKGLKKIKDCVVGEEVLSLLPNGKTTWKKIVEVSHVGMERGFLVRTRTGNEIICSSTHPFLTVDGWNPLDQLNAGVMIAASRNWSDPKIQGKYSLGLIDTPIEDWFVKIVGYLIGDGSMRKEHISFSCANEKIFSDFCSSLPDSMQAVPTISNKDVFKVVRRSKKTNNVLKQMLKDAGIYGYLSYDKHIPLHFMNLPNRQIAMLLNRLYATDGCATVHPTCGQLLFSSVSHQLALDVKTLLLRFGIVAKITKRKTKTNFGKIYVVKIRRAPDILIFAEKIGICGKEEALARVVKKAKSAQFPGGKDLIPKCTYRSLLDGISFSKGMPEAKMKDKLRDRSRPYIRREQLQNVIEKFPQFACLYDAAHSDIFWDEIVEIKDLGKEVDMYDLGVEGTHNFVANSIFVHNSYWICAEAIQRSFDIEGNVGFLCRKENSTFKRTTLRSLQTILPPEAILRHNKSEQFYELINSSVIYYGGLKSTDTSKSAEERIKSMTLGWFGIDEASEVPEELFIMLCSRLRLQTGGMGKVKYKGLLTSNPEPGWLLRRFVESKLPDHIFIPATIRDNPYVPEDYEDNLRQMFPPDLAKAYIDGDWYALLGAGERNVFPYGWVKSAVNAEFDEGFTPIEMGVDPGRGGDESVVFLRHGVMAIMLYAGRMKDTAQFAELVAELAGKHQPEKIKIDVSGLGAGVYDILSHHPQVKNLVREYNGGWSPNDGERFMRLRSETHWNMRKRFEEGKICIPHDEKLIAELVSMRYTVKADRRIYVETKEEMLNRGLKSPNRADALMYAFAEGKVLEPPEIYLW